MPTFAGTAAADPSPSDWSRLRICESSGRYDVVAANGHYGAYQFDLPTWRSVGGTGLPSDASPAEQDQRALALWKMRGWQPWTCAKILGLGDTPSAPTGPPAWPGKVWVYGDCDPALRTWQLRMNHWGYDFQGTGCYYDKTRGAVLDLQRANGLPTSGKLGPLTWKAAWDGTAPVVGSAAREGVAATPDTTAPAAPTTATVPTTAPVPTSPSVPLLPTVPPVPLLPTIPPVSIPAVPSVPVPAIPPVSIPAVPPVSIPPIPPVSIPPIPPVVIPPVPPALPIAANDPTTTPTTAPPVTSGSANSAPPAVRPSEDGAQAAVAMGWGPVIGGDEFSYSGAPDPTRWTAYSGPGHDGKGTWSPAALRVDGSSLVITGDAKGTTGGIAATQGRTYGRWEARMSVPAGDSSYDPVLLLWPDSRSWPCDGEIDYAETSANRTDVSFHLHNTCANTQTSARTAVDLTKWHDYAVDWGPQCVVGYVDAVETFRDCGTGRSPSAAMHQAIQLGWFPGTGAVTPSSMKVDWVRVYEPAD